LVFTGCIFYHALDQTDVSLLVPDGLNVDYSPFGRNVESELNYLMYEKTKGLKFKTGDWKLYRNIQLVPVRFIRKISRSSTIRR